MKVCLASSAEHIFKKTVSAEIVSSFLFIAGDSCLNILPFVSTFGLL